MGLTNSQLFRMLNWRLDIKLTDINHMSAAFKAWSKLTIYCFRSTSCKEKVFVFSPCPPSVLSELKVRFSGQILIQWPVDRVNCVSNKLPGDAQAADTQITIGAARP